MAFRMQYLTSALAKVIAVPGFRRRHQLVTGQARVINGMTLR